MAKTARNSFPSSVETVISPYPTVVPESSVQIVMRCGWQIEKKNANRNRQTDNSPVMTVKCAASLMDMFSN